MDAPKVGTVIRYDFLWPNDKAQGQDHGKDRPCAVVMATKPGADGSQKVVVCPITHVPPNEGRSSIEIPPKVGRHLGLDEDRSWIKTDQVNTMTWPKGRPPHGVTPVRKGQWTYGELPKGIGRQAFEQARDNARSRSLKQVNRDDDQQPKQDKPRRSAREIMQKQQDRAKDRGRKR